MSAATGLVLFFSVLFPAKTWYTVSQPINVTVKPEAGEVMLVLTDFAGKPIDARTPAEVQAEKTVNLREHWATFDTPGTYVLYAVPRGGDIRQFVGTPLVIGVRPEQRGEPQPRAMVIKVEALKYAVMSTDKGEITLAFYYDVAPNSAASFLSLAEGGFYDGLTFHRIKPGYVIQGGDPLGASPDPMQRGTGGPGYQLGAEFSDRRHDVGVLSMARQGDPIERQGAAPRPEYANSAGSQFFICLSRERTAQHDRKYTVFGKVTAGLDVVKAIGETPVGGETQDTPQEAREIRSVRVLPVTRDQNPYDGLLSAGSDEKPRPGP